MTRCAVCPTVFAATTARRTCSPSCATKLGNRGLRWPSFHRVAVSGVDISSPETTRTLLVAQEHSCFDADCLVNYPRSYTSSTGVRILRSRSRQPGGTQRPDFTAHPIGEAA